MGVSFIYVVCNPNERVWLFQGILGWTVDGGLDVPVSVRFLALIVLRGVFGFWCEEG